MEMARRMVKRHALSHAFWLEAIMCATDVLDKSPTKVLRSIIPYEEWHEKKLLIAHPCVFGCLAYTCGKATSQEMK